MHYFMQFAPGIGLHSGYLPGYPASHGCIRMPKDKAIAFFNAISLGTPVTVFGSTSEHYLAQQQSRRHENIPVYQGYVADERGYYEQYYPQFYPGD
jgi:hypothetical protein